MSPNPDFSAGVCEEWCCLSNWDKKRWLGCCCANCMFWSGEYWQDKLTFKNRLLLFFQCQYAVNSCTRPIPQQHQIGRWCSRKETRSWCPWTSLKLMSSTTHLTWQMEDLFFVHRMANLTHSALWWTTDAESGAQIFSCLYQKQVLISSLSPGEWCASRGGPCNPVLQAKLGCPHGWPGGSLLHVSVLLTKLFFVLL